MNVSEIFNSINNYFPDKKNIIEGDFVISEGTIAPFPQEAYAGQFFRIEGSHVNDGVYLSEQLKGSLKDETFKGAIVPMNVPRDFLDLISEIESYQSKVGEASPYVSEAFGGYSYTKTTNSKGNVASWNDAFATRLNGWRKI